MRNCCVIAIVGVFVFLNSCATYSAYDADHDEQIDIYLSTLDDKHFVWCKLDLEQCRADFENWKATTRGRAIIKEYAKENTEQVHDTHHVSNVFRTHFVGESLSIERDGNILLDEIEESPSLLGPDLPSKY